jgi:hypothetical protein
MFSHSYISQLPNEECAFQRILSFTAVGVNTKAEQISTSVLSGIIGRSLSLYVSGPSSNAAG